MAQFDPVSLPFLIPIVGTVFGTVAMVVLVYPFARALAKRMEPRAQTTVPSDASARLARIESAVDAIAIEVERISEGQRFLTKLQSEKLPPGSSSSERTRPGS